MMATVTGLQRSSADARHDHDATRRRLRTGLGPDHPPIGADRARSRLDVPAPRTLFGTAKRPAGTAEPSLKLAVVVERPRYDLTLFRVHSGLLTLKGYTKGEAMLRFEAIPRAAPGRGKAGGPPVSHPRSLVTPGEAATGADTLRSCAVQSGNAPICSGEENAMSDVPASSKDNESLRLELQEAIVSIRHWFSLLIQTAGFITTADVVLISYGFAQKLAGILLLASVLPMGIFFINVIIGDLVNTLLDLVVRIERKLLIREDSLGAALVSSIGKLTFPSRSRSYWLRSPVPFMLYVATAIQIVLFVLALTVFHYRFM